MSNKTADITITIDKETGEQNVDLANVSPDYLAVVFGNAIAQVSKDAYVMGTKNPEQFLKEAVALFVDKTGAKIDTSSSWNDANVVKPKYEGPFICYDRKKNEFYPNMFFDKDLQIFGDENNMGYPDISHWMPMPK